MYVLNQIGFTVSIDRSSFSFRTSFLKTFDLSMEVKKI